MSPVLTNEGIPSTFNVRLAVETGLSSEVISCLAAHQENLYIGTSHGRILHYHQFDEEYVLISQLRATSSTSSVSPVTKFLVLPSIDRILVLVGEVVSVYTVPELTPCRIGKLKGIQDISILSPSTGSTAKQLKNDKVVAFTTNAVRIVQVTHTGMKLLKDINYPRGICGMSTSTSNPNSNYSSLVLCANDSNYDIVDLKLNRKIPLFEHNSGNVAVSPVILPYEAEDTGVSEYLLTIASDETTSLAMFVNSIGDVTRGTMTWVDEGYPSGGLISIWPYVIGIFRSPGIPDKLTVSSLTSLGVLFSESVESVVHEQSHNLQKSISEDVFGSNTPSSSKKGLKNVETPHIDAVIADVQIQSSLNAQLEGTTDPIPDINQGRNLTPESTPEEPTNESTKKDSTEKDSTVDVQEIADSTIEAQAINAHAEIETTEAKKVDVRREEDSSKNTAIKETTSADVVLNETSQNCTPTESSQNVSTGQTSSKVTQGPPSPKTPTQNAVVESSAEALITEEDSQFFLTEVSDISFQNLKVQDSLTLVNSASPLEIPTETVFKNTSKILLYNSSEVWLFYKEDPFIELLQAFSKVNSESLSQFKTRLATSVDHFNGELHQYLLYLLVTCYFSLKQHEEAMKYLLRIKNGNLVVSPLFVIKVSLPEWNHTDLFIFKGIRDSLLKLKIPPNTAFLRIYLDKVYGEVARQGDPTYHIIRTVYYEHLLLDSASVSQFLENDFGNWTNLDHGNSIIIELLEERKFTGPLIQIYRTILKTSKDTTLIEKFCSLSVQVLSDGSLDNSQVLPSRDSLIQDLLSQLNSLDEASYSKYLLEVVGLDQELGIKYLKGNKKFKDVNRKIMQELSGNCNSQSFSLLKIEYLEHSLEETFLSADRDELLHELISMLISSDNFAEEDVVNFSILQSTYAIENTLSDPSWPKVSWIDFLSFSLQRLEHKKFTTTYLKVFELLQAMHESNSSLDKFLDLLSGESFKYLQLFKGDHLANIDSLLELHDYSAAEHFAIYENLPRPVKPYYSYPSSSSPSGIAKDNLLRIFHYYIECKYEVDRINALRHFLSTYSHRHFSPLEILNLLPSSTPVVYLMEYLTSTLVDLNSNSQEALLHKSISKTNASFTKKVYTSLGE